MAGTISEFRSSFNTDVARASRFDVSIPIPLALRNTKVDTRQLSFRCDKAEMPGRTFDTAEKRMGSAPIEKFPYHTKYGDVTLDFIVSDDMKEKIFFDSWMDLINPTTDYNFQYKTNYAVDVSINQYDVTNKLTYTATLIEAYPTNINEMSLDWNTDGYHKIAITFVYKQWIGSYQDSVRQNIINAGLTGLLNDLTRS
jgi:hypothetical protein